MIFRRETGMTPVDIAPRWREPDGYLDNRHYDGIVAMVS